MPAPARSPGHLRDLMLSSPNQGITQHLPIITRNGPTRSVGIDQRIDRQWDWLGANGQRPTLCPIGTAAKYGATTLKLIFDLGEVAERLKAPHSKCGIRAT